MDIAQQLAARLGGARHVGGEWRCLCPAHDDHDPSLSIAVKNGQLLLVCRAGCAQSVVIAALKERGLWRGLRTDREIAATYDYRDESGALLFEVVRFAPKGFRQRRPDGAGGWRWNLDGVRRVPYRLPELEAARQAANGRPPRVYIAEGEKDVDRLREWGLAATCNLGGAGKWRSDYTRHLAGCDVVVLPDNDEAGRTHAHQVAAALLPVAAQVRLIELDGPEKSDVSDWIAAGGTQSDLETLVELAPVIARAAAGGDDAPALDTIALKAIDWLWPRRIARGKLTLFAGHPGLGKSHIALDIAARLSIAAPWPDGSGEAPLGRTLLLSAEDDAADTLLPRLLAAGCDPARINVVYSVDSIAEVDKLAQLVERFGDVAAIVIDPLSAYLGDIDSHKMAEVRTLLRPLVMMAALHNVALIGITHLRKSMDGDAVLLVTGSLAFVAASRATYMVMPDRSLPTRRLVLPAKNNLGRDTGGWAYTITPATVGDGIETSRLCWESDPVEGTADDELRRQRAADREKSGPKPGEARKAEKEFLRLLLADGPVNVFGIKTAANAAGLDWHTVKRARDDLGRITRKLGFADGWAWELPG